MNHYNPVKTKSEPTSLSEREVSVLKALSEDLSVKMIAQHLLLSEFTVQDYIKKIKDKLGARTASGIVAKGFREGMIQ